MNHLQGRTRVFLHNLWYLLISGNIMPPTQSDRTLSAFGFLFLQGVMFLFLFLSIFKGRCVFAIWFGVSNEFLETTRSSSKTLSSKTLTAALLLAQRRGAKDDGSDAPRVGSSELKELTKLVGLCWIMLLAGGFNPFEKHESKFRIFPSTGENKKHLKPPPRLDYES